MQYTQLLDRPIAFHRCFVDITGSVPAALFLSQAIYWSNRTKDYEGWFYKSRDEWCEETGIQRNQLYAIRDKLVSLRIMEQSQKGGSDRIMYYRVNFQELERRIAEHFSSAENKRMASTKPAVEQLNRSTSTAEDQHLHNNTETTNIDYAQITKGWGDAFLSKWKEWKEYKIKVHKFKYKSHISETNAVVMLYGLAGGDEMIALEIIQRSIANEWEGLFKLDGNGKVTSGAAAGSPQSGISDRKMQALRNY